MRYESSRVDVEGLLEPSFERLLIKSLRGCVVLSTRLRIKIRTWNRSSGRQQGDTRFKKIEIFHTEEV